MKARTHRIKDVKGREVTTTCGETLKFKPHEPFGNKCSAWESEVTCKDCVPQRGRRAKG